MFISNYILALISILSLVISFLITLKGLKSKFPLGFLGGSFFVLTIFFTTRVLWYDFKIILDFPHFLKTMSPAMFLPAPLFFLGIRDLIAGKKTWRPKDWIHFFPALFHAIELIPLYLLSTEEKRLILEEISGVNTSIINYPGGWLPTILVDQLRLIQMIAYFGYAWKLILKAKLLNSDESILNFFDSWLRPSLVFFGALQAVFLIQYLFNLGYFLTGYFFNTVHGLTVLLIFLVILFYCVFLINKMRLSLDFVDFSENENSVKDQDSSIKHQKISTRLSQQDALASIRSSLSEKDFDILKHKLKDLLEKKQVFLNHNLLVTDFAKKMDINVRQIPLLLFAVYGKTFNDMINECRVNYAKSKIDEGYLDSFTLESLGEESGFSSRTTFYNAFKKEFSISPNEYWKKISKGTSGLNII